MRFGPPLPLLRDPFSELVFSTIAIDVAVELSEQLFNQVCIRDRTEQETTLTNKNESKRSE